MKLIINNRTYNIDNDSLKQTIARVDSGKVVQLDISDACESKPSNLVLLLGDSRMTLSEEDLQDLKQALSDGDESFSLSEDY